MKVLQSGFYWPSLFKEAHQMYRVCDRCQRLGKLSRRHMMPVDRPNDIYKFKALLPEDYCLILGNDAIKLVGS